MTYIYDNTAVTYGIGRLTKVSNGISTTILAYDALGRVTASQQVTAGQTYNFGYTWDLAGALTSERYPSGRTIQTTYDHASRVSEVDGLWDQQAKIYVSPKSFLANSPGGSNLIQGPYKNGTEYGNPPLWDEYVRLAHADAQNSSPRMRNRERQCFWIKIRRL